MQTDRHSPFARAFFNWNGGAVASSTMVTLVRSHRGLSNLPASIAMADVADVRWMITSTRTGVTSLTITLRYTDDEIEGMPTESQFAVYTAPAANGPWTKVIGAAVNTDVTVSRLDFLVASGRCCGIRAVGGWGESRMKSVGKRS